MSPNVPARSIAEQRRSNSVKIWSKRAVGVGAIIGGLLVAGTVAAGAADLPVVGGALRTLPLVGRPPGARSGRPRSRRVRYPGSRIVTDTHTYLQVCTAVPAEEEARLLARHTVEARLAAAVQVVGPIQSTYWWRGEIRTATEWLCVAKTTTQRFPELAALIRTLHPYEVPEITTTAITHGNLDYLKWISQETGDGNQ
jgi:periplasmic divalent cation tolerance protein